MTPAKLNLAFSTWGGASSAAKAKPAVAVKMVVKRTLRRDGRVAIMAPPCALVIGASCSNCELLCAGMAGLQGKESKTSNVKRETGKLAEMAWRGGCCADGRGATCGRMGAWA